jgi:UDP-GlcNAc:undecaprenyl-phosphate GlcNAc-1-phosphate transferase
MDNYSVALVTFIATIVMIALLRPLAFRIGLLDRPDDRKRHSDSVPLVGGIGIYLALMVAAMFDFVVVGLLDIVRSGVAAFLLAAFILVVVGVWDDLRGLTPFTRIIAQIIAATIMIFGAGIVIVDLGSLTPASKTLFLGALSVPFTIFAVVGLINAVNMADGLDGLVGNMTLVALLGLGYAAALWGDTGGPKLINVLSAAVIGFLVFNQRVFWREKAAVFLGDAGSMMLGFALAWTTIEISQGPNRAISPIAAVWFMAVPVCDTLTVITRRILEGHSPFRADSRHLHHLFIQVGFSVTQTIVVLCSLAALGAAVGLVGVALRVPDWLLLLLFLLAWLVCFSVSTLAWRNRRFLGRDFQSEQPAY